MLCRLLDVEISGHLCGQLLNQNSFDKQSMQRKKVLCAPAPSSCPLIVEHAVVVSADAFVCSFSYLILIDQAEKMQYRICD